MQSGNHPHTHANEEGDGQMGRGAEMRERFQMNKIRVLRRLLTCMRFHAHKLCPCCRTRFRWTSNILYFKRLFHLNNNNTYRMCAGLDGTCRWAHSREAGRLARARAPHINDTDTSTWIAFDQIHSPGPYIYGGGREKKILSSDICFSLLSFKRA